MESIWEPLLEHSYFWYVSKQIPQLPLFECPCRFSDISTKATHHFVSAKTLYFSKSNTSPTQLGQCCCCCTSAKISKCRFRANISSSSLKVLEKFFLESHARYALVQSFNMPENGLPAIASLTPSLANLKTHFFYSELRWGYPFSRQSVC